MERQANDPGKTPIIDDMSHAKPSTTRGRIMSENPRVGGPAKDPEKYRASFEAAQRAKKEADAELQQVYEAAPTEPEEIGEMESQPEQEFESPAPPVNPQKLQSDLSQLAVAGRVSDEIVVAGYKFRMHTLTARENNEALASTAHITDEFLRLGTLRLAIIARSIDSVNGVALEKLCAADQEKKTSIQKRDTVVGSWQQALTIELFTFYDKMLQRSNAVFTTITQQDGLLKN